MSPDPDGTGSAAATGPSTVSGSGPSAVSDDGPGAPTPAADPPAGSGTPVRLDPGVGQGQGHVGGPAGSGTPVRLDPVLTGVDRLVAVMAALRVYCPWDAEQTHQSLVAYLIEETAEVVETIEAHDYAGMREELGDLLLQVIFHAQLGSEEGRFTLADLAQGAADKLVARHPYVFALADVPQDPLASWEQRKKLEKGRVSAIDGIPDPLNTLARAGKVVARIRHHRVAVPLSETPIDATTLGETILGLVARAQASGIDADQALRAAVRRLEAQVRQHEATP